MSSAITTHSPVIPAERSERRDPRCSRKGSANRHTVLASEGWIPAQGRDDERVSGGIVL